MFNPATITLQRPMNICYSRWQGYLLPILKNHKLGLSQNFDWIKTLLEYIIKHKIENINDVDFEHILNGLCPGQTRHSLRATLVNLSNSGKIKHAGETKSLYILSLDRLTSTTNIGLQNVNNKRKNDRLNHAKQIIKCYRDITNKKSVCDQHLS